MANNNHGGVRVGAGRPPIQKIELTLDLTKRTSQPHDKMTVGDLSGMRGTNTRAIGILVNTGRALSAFSPDAEDKINDLIEFLRSENEDLRDEINDRISQSYRFMRASFERNSVEIPREIAAAMGRLKQGRDAVSKKRDSLKEAGITENEILRLVPDYCADDDLRLIDALEAEREKWEKFQQFQLLECLPENAEECVLRCGVYSHPPQFVS